MTGKALTMLAIVVIFGAAVSAYFIKKVPTVPQESLESATTSPIDMWILSAVSPQGTQFEYPEKFPSVFVSAESWPPSVALEAGDYSCAEEQQQMIGEREYCVVETQEGSAGSIYRTYEYITAQGDFLARVKFTLRFPQCANYDEPQASACRAEQSRFDVDGLADRIAQSIRMQ